MSSRAIQPLILLTLVIALPACWLPTILNIQTWHLALLIEGSVILATCILIGGLLLLGERLREQEREAATATHMERWDAEQAYMVQLYTDMLNQHEEDAARLRASLDPKARKPRDDVETDDAP